MGHLPTNPYVLKLKNGDKEMLVIGTQHSRDTLNKMFKDIEKLFYEFNPQLIINEGGNLTKTYSDRNNAISQSGELGLEKYLADKTNIKTYNGDEPFTNEYEELSKAYSTDEAIVYFASERFIFPYAFGQYEGNIKEQYQRHFIEPYFNKNNIKISETEKTFDFYTTTYKKYFKQEFSIDNINQQDFAPFSKRHHFCDITRKSKELRDRYLLRQIESQLAKHDKVMVVYGGWHILAIEKALKQIIDRTNKNKNGT